MSLTSNFPSEPDPSSVSGAARGPGSAPGGIGLREMTASDVAEVLALENQLFPEDAWPKRFFLDELAQAAPAVPAERATRRYWVVEGSADGPPTGVHESSPILGYAGLMCIPPIADVQTIAVAPQAQGRGLGTHMLRVLIDAARDWGAEQVLLEVRRDNPGAQRVYLREGFSHIHTRPRYYPDGEDALIMQKPLTDLSQPSSASNLRA